MAVSAETDALAAELVDVCFHVRRDLGAGLYESVYKLLTAHRLRQRGHAVRTEVAVPVKMDGLTFPIGGRIDLVVDDTILIEAKAIRELHPIHAAQTLTYLRFSGLELGLLVNFHAVPFGAGIKRFIRQDEPPNPSVP